VFLSVNRKKIPGEDQLSFRGEGPWTLIEKGKNLSKILKLPGQGGKPFLKEFQQGGKGEGGDFSVIVNNNLWGN